MNEQKESNKMDNIVSLAKRRGFIFQSSEVYGGMANAWDYGPLGVELKNNIKKLWWKMFVQERDDMVGLDAALIMSPRVWEASGHIDEFSDPLTECKECHFRFRVDHLFNNVNEFREFGGWAELQSIFLEEDSDIKANKKRRFGEIMRAKGVDRELAEADDSEFIQILLTAIRCPNCGKKVWSPPSQFNLMLKTHIGPVEDSSSIAYLRPETAQAIFVNFHNILDTTHKRIPFGVAQMGKAFRNEITTGNFLFRTREFEQMEIEYFVKAVDWEQQFEYWLEQMKTWLKVIGLKEENIVFHEIEQKELAHYSKRTIDIEYQFPFGQDELYGLAYRTDYDLKKHAEGSGHDFSYRDPISGEKYIPHIIEPTFGVDRTVLAVLLESYEEVEGGRTTTTQSVKGKEVVLRLPKSLAPIKAAVLPLSKKDELTTVAKDIANALRKHWMIQYDETGSIGKRYRRQDEIGTPYCITADFDSLNDKKVTVRDRDTMEQERVEIEGIVNYLNEHIEK